LDSIPDPPEVRRSTAGEAEGADETVEQEMRDLVEQQIESHKNEWHVTRLGEVFRIMDGNVNNMSMPVN
jgi:non-homologous end joining protein Ku